MPKLNERCTERKINSMAEQLTRGLVITYFQGLVSQKDLMMYQTRLTETTRDYFRDVMDNIYKWQQELPDK